MSNAGISVKGHVQLGRQLKTETASVGTADRFLTIDLSDQERPLMQKSTPFPRIAFTPYIESAADKNTPYGQLTDDADLRRTIDAIAYGIAFTNPDTGTMRWYPDQPLVDDLVLASYHLRADHALREWRNSNAPMDPYDMSLFDEASLIIDDFLDVLRNIESLNTIEWVISDGFPTLRVKNHKEVLAGPMIRLCDRQARPEKHMNIGTVYLLRCHDRYKIGISRQFHHRFTNLNLGQSPYPLEIIHHASGPDYKRYERMLHERFADKRVHSEWFLLSDDDIPALIEEMNEWANQIQETSR